MPNKITVEFHDGTVEEYEFPTDEEVEQYKKKMQPIVDFFNPDLNPDPQDFSALLDEEDA